VQLVAVDAVMSQFTSAEEYTESFYFNVTLYPTSGYPPSNGVYHWTTT